MWHCFLDKFQTKRTKKKLANQSRKSRSHDYGSRGSRTKTNFLKQHHEVVGPRPTSASITFPLHHCHKSMTGLLCAVIVSRLHRWHIQKKAPICNSERRIFVDDPNPKCSDNIQNVAWQSLPRRTMLEHRNKLRNFFVFLFLFTQPAVWVRKTWYSVVRASQSTSSGAMTSSSSIPQLWYLDDGRLLFIFIYLSNAETWGERMSLKCLAKVRLDELTVVWDTDFFFLILKQRGRGLRERWDKIFCWRLRKIHCTHYNAYRRNTGMSPETLEVRTGRQSGSFTLRAHRAVQTRPVSSQAYATGFFRRLFLCPVHTWAAVRTVSNDVNERANFSLVFRGLNKTFSHRKFPMGYRMAESSQGNTNFQKDFFRQTTLGSLPAGLKNGLHRCLACHVLP